MDTMIDIDKIEAAAKAATPGPWDYDHEPGYCGALWAKTAVVCDFDTEPSKENAHHITTSNPTTVREMVSMIRKQREVMQQALDALNGRYDSGNVATRASAIKALEEALK
jgi:hypothetical protein